MPISSSTLKQGMQIETNQSISSFVSFLYMKQPLLFIVDQFGNLPIVQYLIEKGADLKKDHLQIVQFLVEKGANTEVINMVGKKFP